MTDPPRTRGRLELVATLPSPASGDDGASSAATGGDDERRPHSDWTDADIDVLLVEDNPGDALLVREYLRHAHERAFRIHTVSTLSSALSRLPGAFDLVLLDLHLPDGGPWDVLDKVVACAGGVPVIVLTGDRDVTLSRRCLEGGAQDYVVKDDMSEHELVRSVEYALARTRARRLARRLEHADRLTSLGQLAATVAHEVSNPATFVLMNSNELRSEAGDWEAALLDGSQPIDRAALVSWLRRASGLLDQNVEGMQRVSQLLRDLRAFSRPAEDDIESVDVAKLCRGVVSIVSHHVNHRARLSVALETVPPVRADPRRLGQVLINLVMNAAQSIDGSPHDNEVRIATRASDEHVIVEVADTGSGIPEQIRHRIFDPFFTTKSGLDGTGLGLSISRDIVAKLGGHIEVESTPGSGSLFRVLLPSLPTEAPPARRRSPTSELVAVEEPCRVLLVEDEASVRVAIARGLRRFHEVVTASDGEEALQVLEHDANFGVILCDLAMPGLDGIGLIEQLEARLPDLARRVVVLSGGAISERARAFLARASHPLLPKPTSIKDILRTIATLTSRDDT